MGSGAARGTAGEGGWNMIDVSNKGNTLRYARAEGVLRAGRATLQRVREGTVPKGDVPTTARAAGIAAAKRASDWIVFCHPIPLDWIEVQFQVAETELRVAAEARTVWRTGVEMEALAAVSAALLNAYDMLKPLDRDLTISDIRVVDKQGGQSQFRETFVPPLKTAVLIISSANLAGKREDHASHAIRECLAEQPVQLDVWEVLPGDELAVRQRLVQLVERQNCELVLTSGGTGFGPSDITPEATAAVMEKEVPGVIQMQRRFSLERTPHSMFFRGIAGILKQSLIVNLPGSSQGAREALQALFPGILQVLAQLRRARQVDSEQIP